MIGTSIIPDTDLVWLVFDTLRYDVAQEAHQQGALTHLSPLLPKGGWERRHAPGSFTFPSHQAMFAGFLPSPAGPGPHPRPFALSFPGSTTTTETTQVFDGVDSIIKGFAGKGYRTFCVGGVGFFNQQTPLGSVLPGHFQQSHWSRETGVTDPKSTENQVAVALKYLQDSPGPYLLFMNISAIHQPNWFYAPTTSQPDDRSDNRQTHRWALEYVDKSLAPLLDYLRSRVQRTQRPCQLMLMSDHGTTYGEDGYHGHSLAHEIVWTVPFATHRIEPT